MSKLKTILILMFLTPLCSFAQEPRLSCTRATAAALADTSYILTETKSGGYLLTVQYVPGAIPIESDPTTTVRIRDLKNLTERGELFSRLPQHFTLEFSKEQCLFKSKNAQMDWHCFTRQAGRLGSLSYKGLSFFAYSQKVESPYGSSYWYNIGLEFQLSLEDLYGPEKLSEMMKRASPEERKSLEFRRDYETSLRSNVVIFENTEEHATCRIPEHPYKGILNQI